MSIPDVTAMAGLIADLQRSVRDIQRTSQLGRSSVQGADGNTYGVAAGVVAGQQGASMAASALEQLVDMQSTADGVVTVFYRDDAPTEEADNPEYGDQWLVTAPSTTYGTTVYLKGSLLSYDGDTWIIQQDAGTAAAALAAAENAQDTADGKIVTYWQAADPAPAVTPSSGDLWYQLDNQQRVIAVWRWDSAGGAWRNLPLTTGALAQGGVAPDRLTVGVVANLIQDPVFKTTVRTPPDTQWSVLGPDATYVDSNYIRCEDRTLGALGDPTSDTAWMLTDRVPVDPGRTIRVAALVRCDAAAVVGGPGPTVASLRVWFYATDPTVAALSGTDQIAGEVLVDIMAGAYDQWVPIEGTFPVPEGYSTVQMAAQVTNQVAGHVDYIKPEMQVLWGVVQSGDYVEGVAGWVLSADATQFTNVNVVGDLGADRLSAQSLQLQGRDVGSRIAALPAGIVAYGRSYIDAAGANTAETSGTTRMVTHELHGGPMQVGRIYKVRAHGFFEPTVQGASYEAAILYTTDGTTPVPGSAILDGSVRTIVTPTNTNQVSFDTETIYLPQGVYANTKFSFSIKLLAGSGTAHVRLNDVNRAFEMWVEDWGATDAVPTAGNNGGLVLRSGINASAVDPVRTYSQSWEATWSRSYDADRGTREGDDTPNLYQGYRSATHGNTRSLCGFNYASIQAALVGATIKTVTFTYRVRYAHDAAGSSVYVSSHNYTSKGSQWVASQVNEDRAHFIRQQEGVTYSQALPVAVGNEFKNGSTRGLGFGPGPSLSTSYCAYMYGAADPTAPDAAPVLTITYTK